MIKYSMSGGKATKLNEEKEIVAREIENRLPREGISNKREGKDIDCCWRD